jgi:Domain of unknown function (DUF397)
MRYRYPKSYLRESEVLFLRVKYTSVIPVDGVSAEWRRSSRSYGSGQCVEVAARHGALIDVRDSKNPRAAVLRFTAAQWRDFVAGVRSGAPGL